MKKLFVFVLLFFSFARIFAAIEPSGLSGWKKANNTCVLPSFRQLKSIENDINQQLFYWTSDCEGCFYNQGKLDQTIASNFRKYYICWDSLSYSENTNQSQTVTNSRRSGNLHWSSRSQDSMSWRDAINYCRNLREGGHSDWKLPDIDELRTLIKNSPATETNGACKISAKTACLSEKYCWSRETCAVRCRQQSQCDNCDSVIWICSNHSSDGRYSIKGDNVNLWSSSMDRSVCNEYAWGVDFTSGSILLEETGTGDCSLAMAMRYVRCVR